MHDPQEHRRHQAIARYVAGDNIKTICREMRCAKRWLDKWQARYCADDPAWATRLSTHPRRMPHQTAQALVQRLILLYQTLLQGGTVGSTAAIHQGLQQQGIMP